LEATPRNEDVVQCEATTQTLTEATQGIAQEKRDAATQTVASTKLAWKPEVEAPKIKEVTTYEDFSNVAELRWSDDCYKCTKMEVGSPINAEMDTVIWVPQSDAEMTKGLPKTFKDRYPHLRTIEGPLGWIKITSARKARKPSIRGESLKPHA